MMMKSPTTLFCFLFCVLFALALSSTSEPSHVLEATDSNFKALVLGQRKKVFVLFYAPWCTSCVQFEPTWEEAAKQLKDSHSFVKVNCDKETSTCEDHSIQGYPTIRAYLFISSSDIRMEDYSGFRETSPVVEWATSPISFTKKFVPLTAEQKKILKAKQAERASMPVGKDEDDEGLVVRLHGENFDRTIHSGTWLVLFEIGSNFDKKAYPLLRILSGNMKKLAGEEPAACSEKEGCAAKNNKEIVRFAKINVYKLPDLQERYMLRTFPIFVLFKNGQMVNSYFGEKTLQGLQEFLFDNIQGFGDSNKYVEIL